MSDYQIKLGIYKALIVIFLVLAFGLFCIDYDLAAINDTLTQIYIQELAK